jgi:uncharacterized protein (TIGR03437 family)
VDASPGLFALTAGSIAATHANGVVISAAAPARPGEGIVIYGTGLGRTDPAQVDGRIPRSAAQILLRDRLSVLLDGQKLPAESVFYAGITPGYPGLYQINLWLPSDLSNPAPEVRVALDDQISQSALILPSAP